jgi:hypothetical protein
MTQDPQNPPTPLSTAESHAYATVTAAASVPAKTPPGDDWAMPELRPPVAAVLEAMLDELVARRRRDADDLRLIADAASKPAPLRRGTAGIRDHIDRMSADLAEATARAVGYTVETEDGELIPPASLADARDLVEASIVAIVLGQPIDDPDTAGVLADLTASLEALRRLAPPGPGPEAEERKKLKAALDHERNVADAIRDAARQALEARATMHPAYLEPGSVGENLGRALDELAAQVVPA